MAEVVLDNVSKMFPNGVRAVDRLSLHVHDREFIVLVGPSGCGKTTSLRMIAGLEEPTEGTIRIGDRVVNDVPPRDRDVAMVFQNYALYPHMSVYRNLAFGLLMRRRYGGWSSPLLAPLAPQRYRQARDERREIDQRVRRTAAMLGLGDLLGRRPRDLSGGQRQRVALGRAIVREPRAFLFDEPLSNLDARLRIEMRAELKLLHRRIQTTTLYVTHDQEEAMTLGDRVVVMKDGAIHQCGSPFEVYERPANRFVAGFMGMPPMNFLDGHVVRRDGGLAFENGACRLAINTSHANGLAGHAGLAVVMGIRPEALRLAPASAAEAAIQMTVRVVEPLGDRMDVHGDTDQGQPLVCRTDARATIPAERVGLCVDMNRAHFFEADSGGRRLS